MQANTTTKNVQGFWDESVFRFVSCMAQLNEKSITRPLQLSLGIIYRQLEKSEEQLLQVCIGVKRFMSIKKNGSILQLFENDFFNHRVLPGE